MACSSLVGKNNLSAYLAQLDGLKLIERRRVNGPLRPFSLAAPLGSTS